MWQGLSLRGPVLLGMVIRGVFCSLACCGPAVRLLLIQVSRVVRRSLPRQQGRSDALHEKSQNMTCSVQVCAGSVLQVDDASSTPRRGWQAKGLGILKALRPQS